MHQYYTTQCPAFELSALREGILRQPETVTFTLYVLYSV